jgi:TonB family protein
MNAFVVALVLASIAAVALGLVLQRLGGDAATSHAIVLASVLLPPVLVAAALAGVRLPATGTPATGFVEAVIGPATASRIDPTLPAILGALWLAGTLIVLAGMVVEARRWRGVAARAERIGFVSDRVLAKSAEVCEPTVIGIVDPLIVLPAAYDLEPAELDAVFAHELAHIARRDNLTALAVQLVCAVFWFDPLHRVARRKLVELRERVCDDIVLDRGCDAEAYANALARSCATPFHGSAVACMSRMKLHERMESIMTHEPRDHRPAWIRRTLAAIAVVTAAVVFATFAPAPSLRAGEAAAKDAQNATRPRPLHTTDAVYTEEAKKNHVEGDCVVEITVDEQGNVASTRVVKSLPHGLDRAATDAIHQWKFEPAKRDGKPVSAKFNVTMRFKLDSK